MIVSCNVNSRDIPLMGPIELFTAIRVLVPPGMGENIDIKIRGEKEEEVRVYLFGLQVFLKGGQQQYYWSFLRYSVGVRPVSFLKTEWKEDFEGNPASYARLKIVKFNFFGSAINRFTSSTLYRLINE